MQYFIVVLCLFPALLEGLSSDEWPPWEDVPCTAANKQKAMYGAMKFEPSVKAKPFTKMRVGVKLDDFRQTPNLPAGKRGGGVYIAYTIPGGYLGVQMTMKKKGGKFIFSIWDGGRWIQDGPKGNKQQGRKPKASDKLVWPLVSTCKRNCQEKPQN